MYYGRAFEQRALAMQQAFPASDVAADVVPAGLADAAVSGADADPG